jgi:uncharacterized protein (DUF3084 family)
VTASLTAARMKSVGLQPAIMSALIAVAGLIGLTLAVLAHFRWNDQKLWREAAESRAALVEDLRSQLAEARADLEQVRKEAAAELQKARQEREVLIVRMEAMEAQLAQVQRQNYLLQKQLDEADARNAAQHHERKPRPHNATG